MSIKKLFDSTDKTREYVSDTSEKDAFKSVESAENLEQIKTKQNYYTPHIDYSKPTKFAKFGSAYLYYKTAMTRILDYYPYDGSGAEINKFHNGCLDIEKYILKNLYPRTNGYATLGKSLATPSSIAGDWGLHSTSANREYIEFVAGPGTGSVSGRSLVQLSPNKYNDKFDHANIYDENIYQTDGLPSDYGKGTRTTNLRANFTAGVAVEFWLKTGSYDASTYGASQTVFDMWNGAASGSADYGRITLEIETRTASASNLRLTVLSGTSGPQRRILNKSSGLASDSLGVFKHYAVSLQNSGSKLVSNLYINGVLSNTVIGSSTNLGELNAKPTSAGPNSSFRARLGALTTAPYQVATGSAAALSFDGAARLSGSIDEFRFWKSSRDSKQIGENWFDQVRGGVNSDISNATLGVYYKFNEGIVGKTKTDRIVLDYAGRVTNGFWAGYTPTSRNTASAMVESTASASEYLDPIVRSNHPRVISLRKSLLRSGSYHDTNNNSSFLSLMPGWILDDERSDIPSDLQNICHIAGAYFDKLYLQIAEVPKLKQLSYLSSAYDPFPYAEHLPQSLGLYSPQLFVDASVMETFLNRTEKSKFENDLHDTKNLIYTNLYNNLTHIFKSKGTEKAIRNVFRCFNIDDRLLRLNINTNNNEFLLQNNFQQTLVKEDCLNFNNSNNIHGVVYQRVDSTNPESTGYISGSAGAGASNRPSLGASSGLEDPYGMTVEANIIFPHYSRQAENFPRSYKAVSLFGMHSVNTASAASRAGSDTTLVAANHANFQVHAIKEDINSKNIYFKLTSSYSPYPFPVLTSSVFLNSYDNESWNLSVRLKPSNYPLADLTSGSSDYTYDLIFHGINMLESRAQNSFTLTASISKAVGREFLNAGKRLYVGAQKTNITGALIVNSDVLITSTRYWAKYLEDYSLLQHAIDVDNIGISGSYEHLSALDPISKNVDMKNANALWLDWKFNNITSSNSTGNFYVQDFSSGSALLRNNYGWLGRLGGYQHTGYGHGFAQSSTTVRDQRMINTYRLISPEQSVGSDMVKILSSDDRLFMRGQEDIPNYIYSIEKSLSNAISEEMLDFFAGAVDFHHLIGAPVNRYRHRYKELEKLRDIFFRRVTEVASVEKYIEYYKWFDDALTSIISQLVPASSEFVDDVLNVVESHVLERNKYKSVFPTLKFIDGDVATFVRGIGQRLYPWDVAHSPTPSSPRKTDIRCRFWKERALRSSEEITSGDETVDAQREIYKKTIFSTPRLSSSAPVYITVGGIKYEGDQFERRALTAMHALRVPNPFTERSSSVIHGGPNFEVSKNLAFARSALYPAGPVSREGGSFVPENVLVAMTKDMLPDENSCQNFGIPPQKIKKQKKVFKVQHGRHWEDGLGYHNVKSTYGFPFNVMSSSVKTGYNKDIVNRVTAGIEITNLHNDVYGPQNVKPMQGPFTEYAVGGHQSRHVTLNKGSDSALTRPEAWKIVLGTCASSSAVSGAIGMVGADYPPPNYTPPSGKSAYPYAPFQKAVYYRGVTAKRPVNIRNIQMRTGSTILGNYEKNWNVIQSFGAFNNPRKFIDQQPTLPAVAFAAPTNQTTQIRTLLDIRRGINNHFEFVPDYSTAYLDGQTNDSVVLTRFSAGGGIEVSTRGYQDFRASEYSVYNTINNRNLMNRRPWQNMSGTISQKAGGTPSEIRSFDQVGEDHGLYYLAATHTARFGRDPYARKQAIYSLTGAFWAANAAADADAKNTPVAAFTPPGTLQAWWKLDADMSSSGNALDSSGNSRDGTFDASANRPAYSNKTPSIHVQSHSAQFDASDDSTNILGAATWDAIIGNDTGGGSTEKMTFAAWVYKTGDGEGNYGRILDFGNSDIAVYTGPDDRIWMNVKWNGPSTVQWRTTEAISLNAWTHIAVTYDATSSSNDPKIYINGVAATVTHIAGTKTGAYYGILVQSCYIGNNSGATRTWEGNLADIAIWNSILTPESILAIFSAKRGIIMTAGPQLPGQTYDQLPNFHKVHRNNIQRVELESVSDTGVLAYQTASSYDNLNISHQIPRADRQYAWISKSITDSRDMKYAGFQQIFGDRREYRSTATGLVPFYTFVSASDEKGTAPLGGGFQPISRLNTITLDAFSTTSNTLGFPTGGYVDYLNSELNNLSDIPGASYLNLLLARRGDFYGWTWRTTRRSESPILHKELRTSNLSVALTGAFGDISHFRLPPVSVRGRTPLINFDSMATSPYYIVPGLPNNITLKITHNNEFIYFNEKDLTNLTPLKYRRPLTPFVQMVKTTDGPEFNRRWVLYSQNVFPSARNEFLSRSTGRLNYENYFWRNEIKDRLNYGTGPRIAESQSFGDTQLKLRGSSFGSQGVYGAALNVSAPFNKQVVQSSWPLDAPADFLTRSAPPEIVYSIGVNPAMCPNPSLKGLNRENRAGELQNTYFSYASSSTGCATLNDGYRWFSRVVNMSIGALYSRKHMNKSPESVVSPSGIKIAQTGAFHTQGNVIMPSGAVEAFAGEAAWEAGKQAGRILLTSEATSSWDAHPSEPWYNNYTDFNSDLKLVAKGYSVLPEYKISDHVDDYLKYGIANEGKTNTFSVPGTIYNSTTQSFYKDFSNSEFMQGFLGVKAATLLSAKQIRLVCSAAIKFNPYEGFYPAQRTLQLVSQFSRSFAGVLDVDIADNGSSVSFSDEIEQTLIFGGAYRPLMTTLYSPGILYNSIKSGIAVDYPVVFDGNKIKKFGFGYLAQADASSDMGAYSGSWWPLSTASVNSASWAIIPSFDSALSVVEKYTYDDEFWDARLPFEVMIDPNKYMAGMSFVDLESHPYMALNVTTSFLGGGDTSYTHMASNFFGEVGNFFLKESKFTSLESQPVASDLTFPSGAVYGARVKLRRSMTGKRYYGNEYGYMMDLSASKGGAHYPYTDFGARPYIADDPLISTTTGKWVTGSSAMYPLPQDPQWYSGYRETFTMYSRTTAFGPPVSGRPPGSGVAQRNLVQNKKLGYMDSFNGYNWAFTPPYYHGESWADLVFRPAAGKHYGLEDIMAETKVVYRRVDPGPLSGSGGGYRTLIYGGNSSTLPNAPAIYGGDSINSNAMQISASLNLFGVKRIMAAAVDKYGETGGYGAGTAAKKWIIQPKWETPMLNFTNESTSVHPIKSGSGTLAMPSGYGSGSVPRGMWHQFGHIPDNPETGIFMEIGDIPKNWLTYHYDVVNNPSVYNNYNVSGSSRLKLYQNMKSLTDVVGFNKTSTSKRLGQIADSQTISEAVVAIPYITTDSTPTDMSITSDVRYRNKQFLLIPPERAMAAMPAMASMPAGSDLSIAGASIRKLVQKMKKFVLPPELDWVHNPAIDPFAMLIFEFKYDLDRDDLSYIWQNLAPRNYKKMNLTSESITMNLINKELLQENDVVNTEKLRWMLFKIKQRAQTNYFDMVAEQAGESTTAIPESTAGNPVKPEYPISYNWPYDYLSIIELIKMDVDILFKS